MKPKYKIGQLVNYTYSLGCYRSYRIEKIEFKYDTYYYTLSNVAYAQPEESIISI